MTSSSSRRNFLKTQGMIAAGLSAASAFSAPAINDKVRVGCIGVGNRGSQVMRAFLKCPDVSLPVICDVDERKIKLIKDGMLPQAEVIRDFRKVLERKDLDAVMIATPDHWHAIQTIMACQAGKDVYVEKPLSMTIHEGRQMVKAARRHKRVVQVGTHRRSSKTYKAAAALVQSGGIGKVTVARAYRISNMYPNGIGRMAASRPPREVDWDMWLGPRPERPYQDNIHPYKFRWWDRYSSQVANWGVHYFDGIRWLMNEKAPASVVAMGGQYAVQDDRTIPDTLEATFAMPSGALVVFGQYEASGNPAMAGGDVELRGTQGTLYCYGNRFEVIPERGGQFEDRAPRMKAMNVTAGDGDLTFQHVRNFVDCIHNRKSPTADIEKGHRSTTFSLLANISLAVGARLEWDGESETITNPKSANKLLHYEYRAPWVLPG